MEGSTAPSNTAEAASLRQGRQVELSEAGGRSRAAMASSAGDGASAAAKNDSYVRADKIDLESLDIQLEKQLAKTWEKHKGKSIQGPREDWEIDLAKLEIRYVIAQGTYGTVYRGTYDGQDVAGTLFSLTVVRFCCLHEMR